MMCQLYPAPELKKEKNKIFVHFDTYVVHSQECQFLYYPAKCSKNMPQFTVVSDQPFFPFTCIIIPIGPP